MKKIVLAALFASVAMTNTAKADASADFCAAVFAHAAGFVEKVDTEAYRKFGGLIALLIQYKGVTDVGLATNYKNITDGLVSGRRTMADLTEAVEVCIAEYAK